MSEQFDLIWYQQAILDCFDPKQIFTIWDSVCRMREKNTITNHEWSEIKDTVDTRLRELKHVKTQLQNDAAGGETAR